MKLDWFDSLDSDGDGLQRLTTQFQEEINPEIVLGADLVSPMKEPHILPSL